MYIRLMTNRAGSYSFRSWTAIHGTPTALVVALIWLDTEVNGSVLKLLHSHFSTFISSLSSHSIIMSATAATTTTTAFEERPVTPDQPITRHEGDSSCKRRFYTQRWQ